MLVETIDTQKKLSYYRRNLKHYKKGGKYYKYKSVEDRRPKIPVKIVKGDFILCRVWLYVVRRSKLLRKSLGNVLLLSTLLRRYRSLVCLSS